MHELVSDHHLRTRAPEAPGHLRVDEHPHGGVAATGAVGRGRDGSDGRIGPFGHVQSAVEVASTGRHLHHHRLTPCRQHASDHRDGPSHALKIVPRLRHSALTGGHDQCSARTPHGQSLRQPQRSDAVATAQPGDRHPVTLGREADEHLRSGGLLVEARDGPRERDGSGPRTVLPDGPDLVDVARRQLDQVERTRVRGGRGQLLAGVFIRRRSQVGGIDGVPGLERDHQVPDRPCGSSGPSRRSLRSRDVGLVGVALPRQHQPDKDSQAHEQRKTGHPPSWATGLRGQAISQGEPRRHRAWSRARRR